MPTPASSAAQYTSNTDNWPTPMDFYERLDDEFSFAVDVCSSVVNHKAPTYYALDHADEARRDGLAGDWAADAAGLACWMNPPYGRTIASWMRKAYETAQAGAVVVCLVPVRSSAIWWHELVLDTGAEVRYVRGRLTFGDAKNSAPFASAVVVYRPTDVAGAPGVVGAMPAKPPVSPARPVTRARINSYISEFAPRTVDSARWSASAQVVRDLVTDLQPRDMDDAAQNMSAAACFLGGPDVWDGNGTPDLRALLTPERIERFVVSRFSGSTARTMTHKLERLGRAAGTIRPERVRRHASPVDPFFVAAATLSSPFNAVVAARARATGRHIKWLGFEQDLDGVLRGAGQANDTADSAVTLWPSAALRELTEATNRDLAVTMSSTTKTVPLRTDSPVSSDPTAADGKPMSRRAALAAARAAQAAKVSATQSTSGGADSGPTTSATAARRRELPNGDDVPADIRVKVNDYLPDKKHRPAWLANVGFGRSLVFVYEPTSVANAGNVATHVAALLQYMSTRHGRDGQVPLGVDDLFAPGLIETFLDHYRVSERSKSTVRSILRRVLRNIDPSGQPAKHKHHKLSPPYSPDECDQFARLAFHQPTQVATRNLCFVVGLGLGAGIDASDLRHLTPACIGEVLLDGEPVLTVTVPAEGDRGRTVPVRRRYEHLLRRALQLHKEAGLGEDDLLVGKVSERHNVVGGVRRGVQSAERVEATIELRMSRLRHSWLVAVMCAPISLSDLLRAAGLRGSRTLSELLEYCPPPQEDDVAAVQAALAEQSGAR
jgi:phage N-6-adenine-methyltransferase